MRSRTRRTKGRPWRRRSGRICGRSTWYCAAARCSLSGSKRTGSSGLAGGRRRATRRSASRAFIRTSSRSSSTARKGQCRSRLTWSGCRASSRGSGARPSWRRSRQSSQRPPPVTTSSPSPATSCWSCSSLRAARTSSRCRRASLSAATRLTWAGSSQPTRRATSASTGLGSKTARRYPRASTLSLASSAPAPTSSSECESSPRHCASPSRHSSLGVARPHAARRVCLALSP